MTALGHAIRCDIRVYGYRDGWRAEVYRQAQTFGSQWKDVRSVPEHITGPKATRQSAIDDAEAWVTSQWGE